MALDYLGILFPPNLNLNLNFHPLMKKISFDMDRWAPLLTTIEKSM